MRLRNILATKKVYQLRYKFVSSSITPQNVNRYPSFCFLLRLHKSRAIRLSFTACAYSIGVHHPLASIGVHHPTAAPSIRRARAGPELAAEAIEAVRSDRTTFRTAPKTFDVFNGSPQKCVSVGASVADRVGRGAVLSISGQKQITRGSVIQRALSYLNRDR